VLAIPEAAYLAIILALRDLQNTSSVLLRQGIELVLKHIFFATHPTEYRWAQRRDGYRELGFQYLIDYLNRTDELHLFSGSEDLTNKITDWYSRLSRHVHVYSRTYMKFSKVKAKVTNNPDLSLLRDASNALWPRLALLLCLFSPSRFDSATHIEKRLISDAFGPHLRAEHNRFLRDVAVGRHS
jgi:hypothetical protein